MSRSSEAWGCRSLLITAELELGSRLIPLLKLVTLVLEVVMSVVHLLILGSGGGVGRGRRCDCMFRVPGSIGGLLWGIVMPTGPELEEDDVEGGFTGPELEEYDVEGGFMKFELEEEELMGGLSGECPNLELVARLELVTGCTGISLGECMRLELE